MTPRERDQRRLATAHRLVGTPKPVPTSRWSRLGRLAANSLRGGRLWLGGAWRKRDVRASDWERLDRVVDSLGELKGVAMKVGQTLSYLNGALPDAAQAPLAALQTHAPPLPFATVRDIVRTDLAARAGALLDTLEPAPVGAASIGQVHRARLADGSAVAVKVQYPGIADAVRNDFGPAALGARMAALIYPAAQMSAFVAEARARFVEECDYRLEAERQRRFAALCADHATLRVPAVHDELCGAHVLTTTFVEGEHLDTFLARDPAQVDRDRVGKALFDYYLGTLFRHGLYNCDPHPGNFLISADGTVAVVDHGCTRQFEPAFVRWLAVLSRAAQAHDDDKIRQALYGLGGVATQSPYDADTVRAFLLAFWGPGLRDDTLAFPGGADAGAHTGRPPLLSLALPGEFLFLLRVRVGLASVLNRLGARQNWYQLERDYVRGIPAPAPVLTEIGFVGPSQFDVVLVDGGKNVIQLVRELRTTLELSIQDANQLVQSTPSVVRAAVSHDEAEALRARLEDTGARVEVRALDW